MNRRLLPVGGSDPAEQLIEQLRAEGRRITAARRSLADALAAGGRVTAEGLFAQLQAKHPDLAASTVYRTLVELENLGLVVHVHLGHGPAVYHLADTAHVHLVCDGCGAITELPPDMVHALVAQVAPYGFQASFHHFSIGGRCRSCVSASRVQTAKHGQRRVEPGTARRSSERLPTSNRKTPRRAAGVKS